MPPTTRSIGIKEVAAAAGVSVTTVSHALSGKGRLPDATRVRVREIAERLGYRPNAVAQSLVSGRSGVIGATVSHATWGPWPFTDLSLYAEIISGATVAAIERDYALVVVPATPRSEWSRVPLDGLIVIDPGADDPVLAECGRRGLPAITNGRPLDGSSIYPCVDNDHAQAMETVLDHLRAAGARRVALLSDPPTESYTLDCQTAFRDRCAQSGLDPVIQVVEPGAPAIDAAVALLSRPDRPDAVHGVNDLHGLAALAAAQQLDLTIPRDLLLSCTSESPVFASTHPSVTTLSLGSRELGATAVALLIKQLSDGGTRPGTALVPTRLIRRGSTRRDP